MNVLVTGGTRGIGNAIVNRFASAGHNVFYTYRINSELAAEIDKEHNIMGFKCDVRDDQACRDVVSSIASSNGYIDVLVNNAGITRDSTFAKMTGDSWREVLETNLMSIFGITQAVFVCMSSNPNGGAIINISSVIGQCGNFGQTNYAASKAGLIGFTKSLALEGAKANVTVNAIAPGFIETEMTAQMPKDVLDKVVAQIPYKKLGDPKDIAEIANFLTTSAGRYITGQVIGYNGGYYR